ncbi:hypothetical protein R6Q59_012564 [Mikania micrantha]
MTQTERTSLITNRLTLIMRPSHLLPPLVQITPSSLICQPHIRTIAKGPETTTWIWNLHVDAHDFDSHTSDLEEISRKVFSAHFGQLSIIFLWLSGMYFHGARFSDYEAWLSDPTHIGPSAQIWRSSGITSELQLYCTAIGALIFAALMLFAGWFHYHKAAPKLAWFQDVESMLNHHLAGLLGLGSFT